MTVWPNRQRKLRRLAASGKPVPVIELPKGIRLAELDDMDFGFDLDDYDDTEREALESLVIDAATAAESADELDKEVNELDGLVKLADGVRNSGIDTKWVELRNLLRSEHFAAPDTSDEPNDGGPRLARKLIVFSEHKDTLEYVADRIESELGRPEAVVRIHGGVKRHDRRAIQDRFRVDPTVQVLVATDAAGEGVNLQTANMMVNYDLPWNPNRIEQRFGRVHRIGQHLPCHLWNLVAHRTREGKVFERLFDKIEQQRIVYGDQVYDVLGASQINISLRDLLMQAIVADTGPAHAAWMDEVIEADIGPTMEAVLKERALIAGLADPAANDKIRRDMEIARARKLQPWFVETFFTEALRLYGGRITGREPGRFEVTRVPATVRAAADPRLGPVQDRYQRVTFDKANIQPDHPSGSDAAVRADLISPGTPLLSAVIAKVLADHASTLQRGAVLIDPTDSSTEPRLLVYLDHTITDGRQVHHGRQVVSRRFHYVEIDRHNNTTDPGGEPYLNYAPLTDDERDLIEGRLDLDWASHTAEDTARAWAIEHLAGPHFDEIDAVTDARVAKVKTAVAERLHSEIRYWDKRASEIKAQETAGRKPRLNSTRAQARAEELATRLEQRRPGTRPRSGPAQQPANDGRRRRRRTPGPARRTSRQTAQPRRRGRASRNRPPRRGRGHERRASPRTHTRGTAPLQPRLRRALNGPCHQHLLLHRSQRPPPPNRTDQRQQTPSRASQMQLRTVAPGSGVCARGPRNRTRGALPDGSVPGGDPAPSPDQRAAQRRRAARLRKPAAMTC